MRPLHPLALCLALCGIPAGAQSLADPWTGLWGSVADPALSCATNPHRIDLMDSPPHAFLTWARPRIDADGQVSREATFDILQAGPGTLTLRREGRREVTETGQPLFRILRLTEGGARYCWGRSDWPVVRCEDHQERCDAVAPSS